MINYITPFYSQKHSETTLVKGIESLLGNYRDLQVKLFVIYIDPTWWKKLKVGTSKFELLSENKGIFLFKFSFQIQKKKKKKKITGKLFIIENKEYENVYTVVTIENTLFFSRGLLPYFKRSYPRASLTFITHKKLKNLLISFRDKNGFKELTIVRTSMNSRIGKKIVPSVNWPEFTLEKAFKWVAEENGWFQNLTFKVKKPLVPVGRISISRNGVVKTDKYFSLIYSDFILPISKIVFENVKFFSRRARLDNPNRDIRPLSIDFEYEQFAELTENQRFIDAMKFMRASSLSVIHSNPYIHLSMFDYFDGSSFDVWVLSTKKIVIVPQLKASFQSTKRLINHIFDNYAEGKIKDYKVEQK